MALGTFSRLVGDNDSSREIKQQFRKTLYVPSNDFIIKSVDRLRLSDMSLIDEMKKPAKEIENEARMHPSLLSPRVRLEKQNTECGSPWFSQSKVFS